LSAELRTAPDPREAATHRFSAVAVVSRILSVGGAALALAAIAFAAYRLHDFDQKIAQKQAELTKFEERVQLKQQEFEAAQEKLDQLNAELAFAQAAYQKIAKALPAGVAQTAIQETAAADSQAASIPPLIYIQIAREDQRRKANEVQNALRAKGYIVPGVEYVGAKSPTHSQLRYFVRTDEGPVLDRTMELLRSMGVDTNGQYIVMAAQSPRALRPHQFELWFGQDYQPREISLR
jgi:septal ring factor EnvC (AmiA/AmiB activator)